MVLAIFGLAVASYLALEPVIRRRSPHRLTAWTRLAAGRWRDPLVGRDVLIGALLGVVLTLDFPAMPFYPSRWGPTVVEPFSFTRPAGVLFGHAGMAVGSTWLFAGVIAVLLAVTRREWVAVALVGAFLLTAAFLVSGFPLPNRFGQALRVATALALFLRVGILAPIAMYFTGSLVQVAPLTLDASAWYFGASLTYIVALVALAGYGLYTATAGRLLPGGLFGDE